MHHIRASGYTASCYTIPLACKDGPFEFATVGPGLPAPTVCLSFVNGVPADRAIASDDPALSIGRVITAVGAQLAELHKVPLPTAGRPLRSFRAGGACLIAEHMRGEMLAKMESSEHALRHPFFPFYQRQLAELRSAMGDAERLGLPIGVLHGDPFLDNCLVRAAHGGGLEAALVDFEDVAVGPLLFDFACCVIGSCFRPSPDNTFDFGRFDALASGYLGCRGLSGDEVGLCAKFLRLTLLCNCAWRFTNFNIDHREIEGCRDAHVELQRRIVALQQPALVKKIEAVLRSANGFSADPSTRSKSAIGRDLPAFQR